MEGCRSNQVRRFPSMKHRSKCWPVLHPVWPGLNRLPLSPMHTASGSDHVGTRCSDTLFLSNFSQVSQALELGHTDYTFFLPSNQPFFFPRLRSSVQISYQLRLKSIFLRVKQLCLRLRVFSYGLNRKTWSIFFRFYNASRHGVGTLETSSHPTCLGTLGQSSQLTEPLWTDPGPKSGISVWELISTSHTQKKRHRWGMNGRTFSPNPRK